MVPLSNSWNNLQPELPSTSETNIGNPKGQSLYPMDGLPLCVTTIVWWGEHVLGKTLIRGVLGGLRERPSQGTYQLPTNRMVNPSQEDMTWRWVSQGTPLSWKQAGVVSQGPQVVALSVEGEENQAGEWPSSFPQTLVLAQTQSQPKDGAECQLRVAPAVNIWLVMFSGKSN